MKARVRALGHPVHPMVVVFPLGLFVTAVIFDLIRIVSGNALYGQVGYWDLTAGLIGAVVAALTGLTDWTGIPSGSRAKRVGLLHGGCNVVGVVLFAAAWVSRWDNPEHMASTPGFVVEIVAVAVAGVAAWYGGELVDRHGVGVDERAGVDAPSSIAMPRSGR